MAYIDVSLVALKGKATTLELKYCLKASEVPAVRKAGPCTVQV